MESGLRNGALASTPLSRVPTFDCETDLGDLRLILVPPGPVDTRGKPPSNVININYSPVKLDIATNSDKLQTVNVEENALAFFPKDTDIRMRVYNLVPSCLLDIADDWMLKCFEKADINPEARQLIQPYATDRIAADLGRVALRHLMESYGRQTPPDSLFSEAVGLAIATRVVARAVSVDGDVNGTLHHWGQQGDVARVNRAIEYAETMIADPRLSVSQIANVAALAPTHFGAIFKATTGETVYQFILRRRAETAREKIIRSGDTLGHIALSSGFSSQAHMTHVFKKFFGCTPSRIRRERH